jgi:hypothetical protein
MWRALPWRRRPQRLPSGRCSFARAMKHIGLHRQRSSPSPPSPGRSPHLFRHITERGRSLTCPACRTSRRTGCSSIEFGLACLIVGSFWHFDRPTACGVVVGDRTPALA